MYIPELRTVKEPESGEQGPERNSFPALKKIRMRSVVSLKKNLHTLAGILAVLLALTIAGAGTAEGTKTGLENFPVRFGNRESNKIAITMDDAHEREWIWKTAELCRQYGITMTFFPIGVNLHAEERENWQSVLDAGCEIGNHTTWHDSLPQKTPGNIVYTLVMFQQMLDETLGYHYEVRWLRPPYGNLTNADGSMWDVMRIVKKVGYSHALLWDVSEMKSAKKALNSTRNGSILLFHARKEDYACLEELIPMLLEAGYEPVTVSELFGYDPPETSDGIFIYDPKTYSYPEVPKDYKPE